MAVPSAKAVGPVLLTYMMRHLHPVRPREIYDDLASYFPEMTLAERRKDGVGSTGERSKFDNRIRFARNNLVGCGLMSDGIHGQWILTARGRTASRRLVEKFGDLEALADPERRDKAAQWLSKVPNPLVASSELSFERLSKAVWWYLLEEAFADLVVAAAVRVHGDGVAGEENGAVMEAY